MNNHSRNFFDNDEDIVIDMTRFSTSPKNPEVQPKKQNENNDDFEIDLTKRTASAPQPPLSEEKSPEEVQSQSVPMQQKTNAESNTNIQTDLENFSMEGAEKETTIFREIRNGYVIQKTVIIEKKKIQHNQQETQSIPQTVTPVQEKTPTPQLNVVETTKDNTDLKIEALARNLTEPIHSSQSVQREESNEYSQKDNTISRIERSLSRKLLFLTSGFLLAIILIFIIYSLVFGHSNAREEFKDIIASVDPIKNEVEKCILAENTMYKQNCNSNQKSVPHNWDLSNKFLTEKRHVSVSNITIEGGTITLTSNYNNSLKGANYILVPELSPNRTVRWSVSSKSTCLENTLC